MQLRFPRLTPTVKKLLIVLGGAFVAVALAQNVFDLPVVSYLELDLSNVHDGVFLGLAWQPLTYWLVYPPVPAALFNFLFVLLGIYFFLSPFEEAFGIRRTLQLAGVGVLASAVATVLAALVLQPQGGVAGASAIVLAALGAFPVIARGSQILFMFVIPMKAWHVVLLGLALSALSAVLARDPFVFIEYASALGAGVAFAKWMTRPRRAATPKKKGSAAKRKAGPDLRVVRGGGDEDGPRWLN